MTEDAPAYREIELVPGYVCRVCAYAINYAEWPGGWSEDEVAEREADVAVATDDGKVRFVVDLDGRDALRDDTCQYHGERFVGEMYPVSMTRRVPLQQDSPAAASQSAGRRLSPTAPAFPHQDPTAGR